MSKFEKLNVDIRKEQGTSAARELDCKIRCLQLFIILG